MTTTSELPTYMLKMARFDEDLDGLALWIVKMYKNMSKTSFRTILHGHRRCIPGLATAQDDCDWFKEIQTFF